MGIIDEPVDIGTCGHFESTKSRAPKMVQAGKHVQRYSWLIFRGWLGYFVSPRYKIFDNQKLREVLSLPKFIFNSMYKVYVHLTLQFIQ